MARKVAVNGLGRIGRLVLRELLEDDRFEVVAVNDIASMDTLAYLLKHSSERGPFGEGEDIYGEGGALCVGRLAHPSVPGSRCAASPVARARSGAGAGMLRGLYFQ